MPHRLEITLKPHLFDAEGEGVRRKASDYFGIQLQSIRTIHIVTIDADLSDRQLQNASTGSFYKSCHPDIFI
jgi:phosphoribosylformylglycinamidine synthase subunit PurSL